MPSRMTRVVFLALVFQLIVPTTQSKATNSTSSGSVKKFFTTVTLVVDDYDKIIDWYTKVLEFEVRQNEARPGGGRFVTMAPNGAGPTGCGIMLSLATDAKPERQARLGNQVGDGGVFMILHTDDFDKDYQRMKNLKDIVVEFCEEPRDEPYGKVVVFKDLYGNKFDLIEEKPSA